MSLFPFDWIQKAAERIAPHIVHTPLSYSPELDAYIKWENKQVTGSFKVRGALNKVFCLQDWERQIGLVTASAGNHGQGVALAGKLCNAKVTVFASDHAVPDKIFAMQRLGAEVRLVQGGYGDAERAGITYAKNVNATWISPYNDGQVIAGQGTLGLEVLADISNPSPFTWIVPAGGGGLVSGLGVVIKAQAHIHTLVAVQSEASRFLHSIYHTGSPAGVVEYESLADGLAGQVEEGSVTIPLVSNLVDDFILVSEIEIAQAIAYAWKVFNEQIEGSAAVAIAAILSGKIKTRPAVIVITGGNIQPTVHSRILSMS